MSVARPDCAVPGPRRARRSRVSQSARRTPPGSPPRRPATVRMMSPRRKPAGPAGPTGLTPITTTPRAGEGLRVEPEPGPGAAARHAARGEQLVPAGEELLDGDGEVGEGALAQTERGDADHGAGAVDERAAAEGRVGGRHHERAIEHVLPRRRVALHRLHAGRRRPRARRLADAHRPGPVAGTHPGRVTEGRGGPGPGPAELDHAEPGLEVEAHQPRGHGQAVAQRHLDALGIQEHVAHADARSRAGSKTTAEPARSAPRLRRGGRVRRGLHPEPHHGRRHAPGEGRACRPPAASSGRGGDAARRGGRAPPGRARSDGAGAASERRARASAWPSLRAAYWRS